MEDPNHKSDRSDPLVEGVDYVVEGNKWVFTRQFLLKRGYCCESGCRNCPYGFIPRPDGTPRQNQSTDPPS